MRNLKWMGLTAVMGALGLAVVLGCQSESAEIAKIAESASASRLVSDVSGGQAMRDSLGGAFASRSDKGGGESFAVGNMNGNDNGAGGNDNGGNDNGGTNGNDNGGNTNGNDNGGDDLCPDGSFRVSTDLMGGGTSGDMEYRELPGGCFRFRARVEDFPGGTYDVTVSDVVVGQVSIDADGRGELELDTEDGTFPESFPMVMVGDMGDVGGISSGVFAMDCSADPDSCNGNGNTNGNDNGGNDNGGNDNGGTNGNDNGTGGNDNGGNDNGDDDNDNSQSSCFEYVVRVEADLGSKGSEGGEAEYRLRTDGRVRFRVKAYGFATGVYDVGINDVVVGQIVIDDDGKGELEYRTNDGNVPPGFPEIVEGDIVDVGLLAFGEFASDCDGMENTNGGNDNGGNDNTGGNDNMEDEDEDSPNANANRD